MKNSLKFLMGLLLVINTAFSVAQASSYLLLENKHVFAFVPSDVEDDQSGGKRAMYSCDEYENEIHRDRNRKYGTAGNPRRESGNDQSCARFYSKSTGTSWVMTFAQKLGTTARVNKIFKVENNQRKLWAKFDPKDNDRNIYASAGAQRFAERNGDRNADVAQSPNEPGNNEVAQVPQPGRENCAGKNFFEKAACELKNAGVENAVGTIINKSR